jgi:Cof subfamily protein (haloacid dehalogenase superfamily)
MYKLVAIDIDGTLLNSNGELSERTRYAIKNALSKGINIVLTSGRMSNAVSAFSREIGANKFLIAENGASIIDLKDDKIIYSNYINKNTVIKILDICLENNIYYMIYTTRELIVKDIKHMALFFYTNNYNYHPEEKMDIHLAGKEYVSSLNDKFTKIIICDEDRVIYNSIVNRFKKINDIEVSSIPHISNKTIKFGSNNTQLSYSYAEIAATNTDKWNAIEKLMNILNIKREEVIAIGDNINDLKMISNAGLGVAMSNGSPVAREAAKIITDSNDDDGVAKILEGYC